MALAAEAPAISTSKIVLWPVSEKRIREMCLGSTSTATGSCPAPYRTAGILPATRTRRAAFLLNLPTRGLATTTSGIFSLDSRSGTVEQLLAASFQLPADFGPLPLCAAVYEFCRGEF